MVIYVDDIIITWNDSEEKDKLEQVLMKEFARKNFKRMQCFLRIEIAHSSNGIILSQHKYILDVSAETGFTDRQPAKTPIEVNHRLTLKETNIENYQRLEG